MAQNLPIVVQWLARPPGHVDAQRRFGPPGPRHVPWLERVLAAIVNLARHAPAHTVLTRCVPPHDAQQAFGAWAHLYRAQPHLTRARLDPALLDPLATLVPPARVLDKPGYSPFHGTPLAQVLAGAGIETLVGSGTDTDVCVAARCCTRWTSAGVLNPPAT